MGKASYLLKKIRDPKGTFHAKTDTIKDRNSKHLTEAEEIKNPAGQRAQLRASTPSTAMSEG